MFHPLSAYIFFNLSFNFTCFFSFPELSSENLRTCFQIVNAYLYLSATDFLQVTHTQMITVVYNFPLFMFVFKYILFSFFPPQNYAESLCQAFCDLLKDITNEGQVQVLKVLISKLNISLSK